MFLIHIYHWVTINDLLQQVIRNRYECRPCLALPQPFKVACYRFKLHSEGSIFMVLFSIDDNDGRHSIRFQQFIHVFGDLSTLLDDEL